MAAVFWWVAVVGWTGIILVQTWTPRPWVPPFAPDDVSAHLAGFGVLGVLLSMALGSIGVRAARAIGPAGAVALVVATVSEVGQYWVPGRGVEMVDWVANVGGAALGIGLVVWAWGRRLG